MAEVIDHPRMAGLLYYRSWRGTSSASGPGGAGLFVLVQALLLGVMTTVPDSLLWSGLGEGIGRLGFAGLVAADAWSGVWTVAGQVVRLVALTSFVLLWGLVVRHRAWPIARVALVMLLRRKLFWAIYALALMVFLLFFFGQYLMAWAGTQLGEQEVRVGGMGRANPRVLVDLFRNALKLNGSAETYRNFFWFEGYSVMIVLALAGSVLIGNDLRYGSLPFYLSRPISRWDYLLGKGLAVAVFINLLTTIPAMVLFVQYGLLESWDYFLDQGQVLVGILAYGLLLSVVLTTVLLATATWLRRTVPLIMTWTTLFFFCRLLAAALVDGLQFDPRWRLIDLWNNLYLLGNVCLGLDPAQVRPIPQPAWYEAALVLGGVSLSCLSYLILRIRGVEIVK